MIAVLRGQASIGKGQFRTTQFSGQGSGRWQQRMPRNWRSRCRWPWGRRCAPGWPPWCSPRRCCSCCRGGLGTTQSHTQIPQTRRPWQQSLLHRTCNAHECWSEQQQEARNRLPHLDDKMHFLLQQLLTEQHVSAMHIVHLLPGNGQLTCSCSECFWPCLETPAAPSASGSQPCCRQWWTPAHNGRHRELSAVDSCRLQCCRA